MLYPSLDAYDCQGAITPKRALRSGNKSSESFGLAPIERGRPGAYGNVPWPASIASMAAGASVRWPPPENPTPASLFLPFVCLHHASALSYNRVPDGSELRP